MRDWHNLLQSNEYTQTVQGLCFQEEKKMFLDLDDDVLHAIAAAVKNIQFHGPISIVMLSRVCRRFHRLIRKLTLDTKNQWVQGFSASFTWKVERFRERVGDVYSPVFTTPHGHHWRLLLFFNGNGVVDCGPSLYLDVPNAHFLHVGWQRATVFKLKIVHNASDLADIVTPTTEITFSQLHRDWGYKVLDPNFNHEMFCDNFLDAQGYLTVACELHVQPILPLFVVSKVTSKLTWRREKWQILSICSKQTETFACAFCNSQLVVKSDRLTCTESNGVHDAFYSISKVLQPDVRNGATLNAVDEYCAHPTQRRSKCSLTFSF